MDETFSRDEFYDLPLIPLQAPVTETYRPHHDLPLIPLQAPVTETYRAHHDLPLMQQQAPVSVNYQTLDKLLGAPVQENYSNFHRNQVHQPNIHFFKKYDYQPLLQNENLRDVSSEKITPDSTGQLGHVINSENDKTLVPYEIKNHGQNIFPVNPSPTNQRRKKREKSERIVSTNIIQKDNDTQAEKFEIATQAEKFEIADTKITRIKFTDRWKVENEILSQIIHQSSSQKEKKNDGKTSSKKRQKTKDKVQVKLSKDKPIHSPLMTPSANMSIKYSILQSLVQSLVDEDNVLLSKKVTVYSKGINTSTIMYNVFVELARLAQEDQRRIITQCDPGKLKSSKL